MTPRELVTRHWQLANRRDWAAFAELIAPDFVYEVPQTRERVRGPEGYVEFFRTFPGDWQVEIVQLMAEAASAVTVIRFLLPGESEVETGINFFTIEHGRIAKVIDYWPAPYAPPRRMTDRVERY